MTQQQEQDLASRRSDEIATFDQRRTASGTRPIGRVLVFSLQWLLQATSEERWGAPLLTGR